MRTNWTTASAARRKAAELRSAAKRYENEAMNARYPAPIWRKVDKMLTDAEMVLRAAGIVEGVEVSHA